MNTAKKTIKKEVGSDTSENEVVAKGLTAEDLQKVFITIDRDMTDGGIRINGKLYIGEVEVPRHMAKDLLRIQEEYFETKKKLFDPLIEVRMKSDLQKELLFLADPKEHSGNPKFTRDYGLLGMREWGFCSEGFKSYLLTMRRQFYGY